MASSLLILSENGFAIVYSRHSWLTEPNAERIESAMIGRTISHNRIVSQLGSGWMGEVNGTGDLTLQLHVVLNFPPLEMKNDLMPVNACSAKRLLHRRSESPVKIELDLRENEDQLLRMGMSVQPEVWPR